MTKKELRIYSFGLITTIVILTIPSAFGEVIELGADSESYSPGDVIKFHGKTEYGNSGLVTIVIKDNEDDFILLTQTITDEDYHFEKTVKINEKFTTDGAYDAIGFIANMTAGATAHFVVSSPPILSEPVEKVQEPSDTVSQAIQQTVSEEIQQTPLDDTDLHSIETQTKKPDFVDPSKDPQYYLNRYYNEPMYKSWFDKNYPKLTIEEAVGYDPNPVEPAPVKQFMEKEVVPEAEALSVSQSTKESGNTKTAPMLLAVGGLGVLFGAVYGVKRKIDDNSRHISINKDIIRKKIITPLIGSSPLDIIQTRLAKGEISLEEYEILERKLRD